MTQNTQGCKSLGMMGFFIFFPSLGFFLVDLTGFAIRVFVIGMAKVVSLTSGASLGVRGVNPVTVMPKPSIMVGGTKYQTSIAYDIFGNTTISKTCCDTKPVGGYRKGVWGMA